MARAAVKAAEPVDGAERMLQILSESARLFAAKGYAGTSMRDIAEACGISKSLLYHHFTDKDEIYARITLGSTRELYQFVFDRLPEGASPSARIRGFMNATGEYFHRYRWAWIASTTAFWSDPEQRRQKERLMWRDRYETLLRSLIQGCTERVGQIEVQQAVERVEDESRYRRVVGYESLLVRLVEKTMD